VGLSGFLGDGWPTDWPLLLNAFKALIHTRKNEDILLRSYKNQSMVFFNSIYVDFDEWNNSLPDEKQISKNTI